MNPSGRSLVRNDVVRGGKALYGSFMAPLRQIASFIVAGFGAALVHYGTLIGLVEMARWTPVPATLCGYIAGGAVSYVLNHRLTFTSRREHRAAIWRFAIVAGVGFLLTGLSMALLVDWCRLPYLGAQILTTGCVLVWSFVAHKLWTFGELAPL